MCAFGGTKLLNTYQSAKYVPNIFLPLINSHEVVVAREWPGIGSVVAWESGERRKAQGFHLKPFKKI